MRYLIGRFIWAVAGFLAVAVALSSAPAHADGLEAALKAFASDSFSETEAGIAAVASSGSDRSSVILEALADRRLFTDVQAGVVYYTDANGKAFDALSGKPVAAIPEAAKAIRLNNRLRGALDAVRGSLTLISGNSEQRLQSAQALFKSGDVKSLAGLDVAIAKETTPSIKVALREARASIQLANPDATSSEQMDSLAVVAQRADQDAISVLQRAAAASKFSDVQQSALLAISSIERRLVMFTGAQTAIYGLSLGSVLLLAAIGLAITFGVMGVINMAHGEMVMLGAYTTFAVQEIFRAYAPKSLDWSLPVAIPAAFLVAGLVGLLIERSIIRFLYGRPLETLLATWGVSLILQQAVRTYFGASNREVSAPSYMSGSVELFGLHVTSGRLWIIFLALAVFFALLFVMKYTPLGLQMRAVTQNRKMAGSMGIATDRIDAFAFALGSGIAGIAGVALSQIDNVSPNLGQSYIIDSFMVVVFGGVGNLWGTLVSALFLGLANKALEPVAGAVLGKIVILVLLILFIQKRPRGLFALKGRSIEA